MSSKNQGSDFSFNSISNFDEHISSSIPNYIHIHELILNISTYFVAENTNVYDLGCSTGLLLKKLQDKHKEKNICYFGYDISENLLPLSEPNLFFIKQNITEENVRFQNTNLILSVFTLQFLSVPDRIKVVKKIYESLNPGGAFIITEKIYIKTGLIQDIFTFTHYDFKHKEFDTSDILGKQMKLREIMRPLSDDDNVKIMKEVGFKYVESFFQSLNFKGWLCIK